MVTKIQNLEKLAVSPLRRDALRIADAGLRAIDTGLVIRRLVSFDGTTLSVAGEKFKRSELGRIVVGGVGKCALAAAREIEKILGEEISGGAVLDIQSETLERIQTFQGTHPLPSDKNIAGTAAIVGTLKNLTEWDLVIFVVSGGGSTLLCLPEDVGCAEEGKILQALTRSGATIQEINTVRKHLSLARGGYLATYAYPARVVSLIFSDVPGDNIQFVASGPTVLDRTTIFDAAAILAKYDVSRVCAVENCGLIETPKDPKYFAGVTNTIAASSRTALDAMRHAAEALKLDIEVCDACLVGEARDVGKMIVEKLHRAAPGKAFLYGGETTVTIRGSGRGGRNLELALSALRFVRNAEIVIPFASDGRDNGDFAGAICDTITKDAARKRNVDLEAHLEDNNEYPLFEHIGHYLLTGNTNANVSDLVVAIKGRI